MKVVFLDIDGVLNSMWYFRTAWTTGAKPEYPYAFIDRKAVRWLNEIVQPSGAEVVISSTWRTLHSLDEMHLVLSRAGFSGHLVGFTPDMQHRDGKRCQRGDECKAWLDSWGVEMGVTHYVALDDGDDFDAIRANHIHINPGKGLKPRHVGPALAILGVSDAAD